MLAQVCSSMLEVSTNIATILVEDIGALPNLPEVYA